MSDDGENMPAREPTHFERLPVEAFTTVLSFLGDAGEFLAVELTCTGFRRVISENDLDVWGKLIPGNCVEKPDAQDPCDRFQLVDTRFATFRERACVLRNIKFVRRQQQKTSNILLDAFEKEGTPPVDRWKAIITRILEVRLPENLRPGRSRRYSLRGDTMGTVMELLQEALLTAFRRALEICVDTSDDDTYPVLTWRHLRLQDKLARNCFGQEYTLSNFVGNLSESVFAEELVPERVCEKIVQSIAFRAGVTKVEDASEVYSLAWAALVQIVFLLFEPACTALVGEIPNDRRPSSAVRQLFSSCKSVIQDIPPLPLPLPMDSNDQDNAEWFYLLTPVPRMIEEAAAMIPSISAKKVYSVWLTDGASVEEEIASAEFEYDWVGWDNTTDHPGPYALEHVFADHRVGNLFLVEGVPGPNAAFSVVDLSETLEVDGSVSDESSFWSDSSDSSFDGSAGLGDSSLEGSSEQNDSLLNDEMSEADEE